MQASSDTPGKAPRSTLRERFRARRRQFIKDYGFKLLCAFEGAVARASLVGDTPILDARAFPWSARLEAGFPAIRRELEGVLALGAKLPTFQEISKDQLSITSDDRWRTFWLYGFGFRSEANCARCPETARLLATVPGLQSAMFSILHAGKHIPKHRGPFKGIVRYHLGLQVPEPPGACRIRIGDVLTHWEEGKSLIFDDTYEHEVWNDTQGTRVVLFLDIVRPLRAPVRWLNWLAIRAITLSPYVTDAKRNHERWERGLEDLLPSR